ncbi:ROK family transcriptional regulator [Aliiruegeria lutimaris]|uniref:Sugar kinase of the NBD/HSP70 family, may contain an N-terminal HTH domain n=1 Tax=Aliiruegeria lutimaris TaxID=571298 RepID=A0A1G9BLS7_9RHOB|nr:ROK family transcriptional regulator [Aliiruegeria lutimaris]SDK40469.1 Sugar kinase of the NBD/HSP70 family, may contain an N-terminal HTH domain [Aliiruegeria lutimaris]
MTTSDGDSKPNREAVASVRGSNQSGLRAHNERLILSLLRNKGPMPKAEIARVTGLSAQSVSVIMRGLEQEGLLERGEAIRGKVGQPSVPMRLSPNGAYFFGLKIGRRSIDLLLVDFIGNVLGRTHLAHAYPTPGEVIRFALSSVQELRKKLSPEQAPRIAGLGIAIPFRLWDWAVSIGAPAEEIREWQNRDIQQELSEALDFPVYLQNDATAACGAELIFGTGPKPPDFLHFFIGYFVGGGLVLNGRLFVGRTGNAAALGSLPIPALGGAHLQLVDVASLSVLEGMLADQGAAAVSALWDNPKEWNFNGEVVDRWIRDASAGLAYAIAASACVVDCDAVLIDGWIPDDIRGRLVSQTKAALRHLDVSGIELPRVYPGTIGPDGRALGAAGQPLSNRYLVDLNAMLNTG